MFPQDAMHVIIEGPLKIMMKKVTTENLVSLDELNAKIQNFDLGSENSNRPSIILSDHVDENKNTQIWTLAMILPFMLKDLLPNDDPELACFLLHCQVLSCAMVPVVFDNIPGDLRQLVSVFLSSFLDLYGYYIHLPSELVKYGLLRAIWCFRMEAKHSMVKQFAMKSNFKNVPLTVTQILPTSLLRLLSQSFYLMIGVSLVSRTCGRDSRALLLQFLPQVDLTKVYKVSWVNLFGTTIGENSLVREMSFQESPVYGLVQEVIVTIIKSILFVLVLWSTSMKIF
eukprot:Pompholyxophrys_punicea_v1_NODE_371_length_2119_cov_6.810078.p1 type:complete len:284 gc:universal NODE_371_length_2119_cov_6.810078:1347-496(-)